MFGVIGKLSISINQVANEQCSPQKHERYFCPVCHSWQNSSCLSFPKQSLSLPVPLLNSEGINDPSLKMNAISDGDPARKAKFSIEKHVTEKYPKTFIWHTTMDTCVPVSNSLLLAKALEDKKILFEMHIYPALDHGQSLADESVYADDFPKEMLEDMKPNRVWINNAIDFIKKYI